MTSTSPAVTPNRMRDDGRTAGMQASSNPPVRTSEATGECWLKGMLS